MVFFSFFCSLVDDLFVLPQREEKEKPSVEFSHSPHLDPVSERSHETSLPPDILRRKLPYACRDFRNGQCTRGEKCRFMHVYDGNNEWID